MMWLFVEKHFYKICAKNIIFIMSSFFPSVIFPSHLFSLLFFFICHALLIFNGDVVYSEKFVAYLLCVQFKPFSLYLWYYDEAKILRKSILSLP